MSVVKRKKTSLYAQIHNDPLQKFDDLGAIGMLAHLMSLPDDWVIRKVQLVDKFTRRTVDKSFTYLVERGHLLVGSGYGIIEGKNGRVAKQYEYMISDLPFSVDEGLEFKKELELKWKKVKINDGFSTVHNVQYSEYSTSITHTKEIETKTHDKPSQIDSIVNGNLPTEFVPKSEEEKGVKIKEYDIKELMEIKEKMRLYYMAYLPINEIESVCRKLDGKYLNGQVYDYKALLNHELNKRATEFEEMRLKAYQKDEDIKIEPRIEIPHYNWLEN